MDWMKCANMIKIYNKSTLSTVDKEEAGESEEWSS